jgi:hypothetical protein
MSVLWTFFFGPPEGDTVIRLRGRRLGDGPDDVLCVLAGAWPCTDVHWVSRKEIVCRTPSISAEAMRDLTSHGPTFGYERPGTSCSVLRFVLNDSM